MNCPVCTDERLVMADRSGVEIDYCPKCRGVWLDRGELDKLIERATKELATAAVPAAPATPPPPPTQQYPVAPAPQPAYPAPPPYRYDDDDDDRYYGKKKYKKKSILGEIFDF